MHFIKSSVLLNNIWRPSLSASDPRQAEKTACAAGPSRAGMEFMGLMAAEIAHELSRPLTRILNQQAQLRDSIGERSTEGLLNIEREVLRASGILEAFSMLSPETALPRAPTDLQALLLEALQTLGLCDRADIRIRWTLRGVTRAPVHAHQMRQVFLNLLQNAADAMPAGGHLLLGLQARPARQSKAMQITIEDSGSGIAPMIRERVFEAFFTTKKTRGGRGVGLTLSRAMIERHGGTIRLESPSTPRGGTRVIVYLPLEIGEGSHGK